MNRNHKYLALAGALLALPALAFAGPGKTKNKGDRGDRHAKMIQKYDANGDGTLDDAERQAAKAEREAKKQARRADMLAKFDKNNDGTLDDAERKAMHEARVEAMFVKLDTNNDGVLSRAEFAAGKHWSHKGGRHRHGGGGKNAARTR